MARIQINSREEFNKWTAAFDLANGTQTMIGKMTLKEVNRIFEGSDSVERRIQLILTEPFPHDADGIVDVKAHETNYRMRQIMSMRKLYNEDVLTSPLSVSVFPNGVAYIHPGRTRMLLDDIFTDVMDVVITYYRNDVNDDLRDLTIKETGCRIAPILSYDEMTMKHYNVAVTALSFNDPNSMGDQFWSIIAKHNNTENFIYKETYGREEVELKFRKITESMQLQKTHNKVFVDGILMFEKENDVWQIHQK